MACLVLATLLVLGEFAAKQLVPGAFLVHDEHSDHSVQVPVVPTP